MDYYTEFKCGNKVYKVSVYDFEKLIEKGTSDKTDFTSMFHLNYDHLLGTIHKKHFHFQNSDLPSGQWKLRGNLRAILGQLRGEIVSTQDLRPKYFFTYC